MSRTVIEKTGPKPAELIRAMIKIMESFVGFKDCGILLAEIIKAFKDEPQISATTKDDEVIFRFLFENNSAIHVYDLKNSIRVEIKDQNNLVVEQFSFSKT